MRLLSDNILTKPILVEKKTASGIFLEPVQKTTLYYEVIQIGKKTKHIKVGDNVKRLQFSKGTPFKHEDQDCFIFSENEDIDIVNPTLN